MALQRIPPAPHMVAAHPPQRAAAETPVAATQTDTVRRQARNARCFALSVTNRPLVKDFTAFGDNSTKFA